ncbi:MAG: Rpn family recombination-promoting nuclease/putative transposase [Hungatella sp.]|nr:Rpn family recombination-promoting nuclease/putative transposase [Hungatella sp.]
MGRSKNVEGNFVENSSVQISNREVKASVFTELFSDPENAAQLYTALEGVLFVARKNDMAFTVKNRVLVISEHQSTLNQNMPLRSVIYYGRTMERLIEKRALYRNRLIPIPTPEFYMFYNGSGTFPSEKILRLSDAYLEKEGSPMLELTVKVININLPENHSILKKCRPLYEYAWFIQRIRDYMGQGQERDAAIVHAVEDCEREGILADFVRKYGTEAINMLFTQFNMDDALEVRYEEGVEEGRAEGELLKLIKLVCRKLEKGKRADEIAEELEEEQKIIASICTVAKTCGLDINDIYKELQTMQ